METNKNNGQNNMLRYAGLATQWMVMLVIAVWAGWKLDKWIGLRFPVFLVSLPVIALIFSLWQLMQAFNKPKK